MFSNPVDPSENKKKTNLVNKASLCDFGKIFEEIISLIFTQYFQ